MRRLLCIAILSCAPAVGATLESFTLEQLARNATSVVRGTLGESRVARFGALIYTLHRFEVAESWSGVAPSDLEIAMPGGSLAGVAQTFSGLPALEPGKEYVAFLWTGPSGRTQIVGFSQGLFEIQSRGDQEIAVRSNPSGTTFVGDTSGGSVSESGSLRIEIQELLRRVQAAAGSADSPTEASAR